MQLTRSFILVLVLLLLYDVHYVITTTLTVRLLEDATCNRYLARLEGFRGNAPESACKIVPIQSQLAYVRGWYAFYLTLPSLLVGPLIGGLADRCGRRPVFAITLTGSLLQLLGVYTVCYFWRLLKVELTWIAALFSFISGGPFVILGINLAMTSDLSEPEQRSQYFYVAFSVRYIAGLVGPQITALTLSHSLWLTTLVASLCIFVSYPVLLFLPETLKTKEGANSDLESRQTWFSTVRAFKDLAMDWRVATCMALTFLLQFQFINESILLPYASVRFSWTIGQVAQLLSIIPTVSLLLFVALPFVTSKAQTRFQMSEQEQSHLVFKALLLALIIGDAVIIWAPNIPSLILALVISGFGNGTRAPLMSVASSYINTEHLTARLYTLLSVTGQFANMVGDPALQSIWSQALQMGGRLIVLPFVITFACFVVALLLSLALPVAEPKHHPIMDEGDSETDPLLENANGEDSVGRQGDRPS